MLSRRETVSSLTDGAGTLKLTFDETVKASSLTPNQITIQDAPTATTFHTLGFGVFSLLASDDSTVLTLTLDKVDLDLIKRDTDLAVSSATTWLVFSEDAFMDMNSNKVNARVNTINALGIVDVANFAEDLTAPTLSEFEIDMNAMTLTVSFSEPIAAIETSDITIQSCQNTNSNAACESFKLTGSPWIRGEIHISTINDASHTIPLSETDANSIKALGNLAVGQDSTFLSFPDTFATDMNGRSVIAHDVSNGAPCALLGYTPDITPPELRGFAVNVGTGQISFTYSETMKLTTFAADAVYLHDSANYDEKTQYFSGSDAAVSGAGSITANGYEFVVQLSDTEMNRLKQVNTVCATETTQSTSANAVDCYMYYGQSIHGTGIEDMAGLTPDYTGNTLTPNPTPVTTLTVDNQSPSVLTFVSLDLDTGIIEVEFDETINNFNVLPAQMTLQNFYDSPQSYVNLFTGASIKTGGDAGTTGGCATCLTRIKIQLSGDDVANVQRDRIVCKSKNSCYLKFTETFARDMAGNPIDATNVANANLVVGNLNVDSIRPSLATYTVDMATSTLSLTFDEPVQGATLTPSDITLKQGATSSLRARPLQDSTVESTAHNEVQNILLGPADMAALRALHIATTAKPFLDMASTAAQDTATNPNSVNPVSSKEAFSYTAEGVAPTIDTFDLTIEGQILTISFNEPVLVDTFDPTSISFLSSPSDTDPLQLTDSVVATVASDAEGLLSESTIAIQLSADDISAVKLAGDRARASADTYIAMAANGCSDPSTNAFAGLASMHVTNFVPDATVPAISDVKLDMEAFTLTITFDDVIDGDSATLEGGSAILQNAATSTAEYVTLTDSVISSPSSRVLVITLSATDSDAIKLNTAVGVDESNTWLRTKSTLVQEAGPLSRFVSPAANTQAVQASHVEPDITPPTLLSFYWDLNTDPAVLVLVLSEAFNQANVDLTKIGFESVANGNSMQLLDSTLNTGSVSTAGNIATINWGPNDLNGIKELIAASSAIMTVLPDAFFDMGGVGATPVTAADFLTIDAANEVADETSPAVSSYVVDLALNTITFEFTEVVKAVTFTPSAIVLQDAVFRAREGVDKYVTISDSSSASNVDSTTIVVTLSKADRDALKTRKELGTTTGNTYLVITTGLVEDMFANPVTAIEDGSAKAAALVTPDDLEIELDEFDLNMNTGMLTLSFSESPDLANVYPERLVLQSLQTSSATSFPISGYETIALSSTDPSVVNVKLKKVDMDAIKAIATLATKIDGSDTFLSFNADFAQDSAATPNAIVRQQAAFAKEVNVYTQDQGKPALESFDFNMNYGQNSALLTMYFSETVDPTSLQVGGLTIIDSRTRTTSVTLAPADATWASVVRDDQTVDTTAVALELSFADLNKIKHDLGLATARDVQTPVFDSDTGDVTFNVDVRTFTTFLTIDADSIEDMANNGNVAIDDVGALDDEAFTEDTTAPQISAFSLDLSNALIYIQYSEPLDQENTEPTEISIQGQQNEPDATKVFTLTGGTVTHTDLTELTIRIRDVDMNEIRLVLGNNPDADSTFLSVSAAHTKDTNGNELSPIGVDDAQKAAGFLPDTSPPVLSEFVLDLTNDKLFMTFSEPIHGPNFSPQSITIRNDDCDVITCPTVKSVTLGLTSVAVQDPVDTLEVVIEISREDMNKIKGFENLGVTVANTFISAAAGYVSDLGGIPAQIIEAD
eukprot:gene14073-34823_t